MAKKALFNVHIFFNYEHDYFKLISALIFFPCICLFGRTTFLFFKSTSVSLSQVETFSCLAILRRLNWMHLAIGHSVLLH